jgi:hypothetical protein
LAFTLQKLAYSPLHLEKLFGKLSLTISAKPVGVGAVFERLIPTGERSGLQTHTAVMESVSLSSLMKS